MQTEGARTILRQRSGIVEPVFAIFREQVGLMRFLVRGPENVKAEWRLLAIAHNLRRLWKLWWRPKVRHDLVVGRATHLQRHQEQAPALSFPVVPSARQMGQPENTRPSRHPSAILVPADVNNRA